MLTVSQISLSKPVDPNMFKNVVKQECEVNKKVVLPSYSVYFRANNVP